jgi:hypothetical protein
MSLFKRLVDRLAGGSPPPANRDGANENAKQAKYKCNPYGAWEQGYGRKVHPGNDVWICASNHTVVRGMQTLVQDDPWEFADMSGLNDPVMIKIGTTADGRYEKASFDVTACAPKIIALYEYGRGQPLAKKQCVKSIAAAAEEIDDVPFNDEYDEYLDAAWKNVNEIITID